MIARVLERGQRTQNVIGQREHRRAPAKVFAHRTAQRVFVFHQHVDDLLNALHTHFSADGTFFNKGLILHIQQLANADGWVGLSHHLSPDLLLKTDVAGVTCSGLRITRASSKETMA